MMLRRALTTFACLLAPAFAVLAAPASSPAAGLGFVPCPTATAFSCTSLTVPLLRSGAVPGTISLSVERKLAGATPSHDAVVALAGGPGQAALPLAEFIAQAIAPALAGSCSTSAAPAPPTRSAAPRSNASAANPRRP
jgi:hypothetical protein